MLAFGSDYEPKDIASFRIRYHSTLLIRELESPVSGWADATFAYANVPIFDHHVPTIPQLKKALRWIGLKRNAGKDVLIHCALGQGRSVMMAIAFMLSEDPEATPKELLQTIQKKRRTARPNRLQMRTLEKLSERNLRGASKSDMTVIMNPASGPRNPKESADELRERLESFSTLQWQETTPDVSASELARRALARGEGQILAAGRVTLRLSVTFGAAADASSQTRSCDWSLTAKMQERRRRISKCYAARCAYSGTALTVPTTHIEYRRGKGIAR